MPTKKKTTKTANKKEKELEKMIEALEETIQKIENTKELEKKISEKAEQIREDLQDQLRNQNKFGKQFDDMVEDYIYFFRLKEELQNDINTNGIRYKATGGNGFTTYKPNESCERLIKTNAQMLKILQDLNLKTPDETPEEGEEDDLL